MTETNLNLFDFTKIIKDLRIFIDKQTCNGCGLCGEICPFGLPQVTDSGKYEIRNPDLCTECSACKRNCPTQAIVMNERKGCGCLWDARGRAKSTEKRYTTDNSCTCGSDEKSNSNNICCGV
jgi:ferredoxin